MHRYLVRLLLAALLVLVLGEWRSASADITGFIGPVRVIKPPGLQTAPGVEHDTRLVKGVAVGFSMVIVGFEAEWAHSPGNEDSPGCATQGDFRAYCAPSLTTGMFNALVQTPHGITRFQLYATAGAGVYKERFSLQEENNYGFGTNIGGGVKVTLVGPLRLRLDYRVFKLANGAYTTTPQRFYAGANLAF